MSTEKPYTISIQIKVITLWAIFLFGMIFHTQLGLIPLFYGEDIVMPHTHHFAPHLDLWLMLGFYAIPILAIIFVLFKDTRPWRLAHFLLTMSYSVLNVAHIAADLAVSPVQWYQIALITLVFGNGILLNFVAYQWLQQLSFAETSDSANATSVSAAR